MATNDGDAAVCCADRIMKTLPLGDAAETKKALMAAFLNGVVQGTVGMTTAVLAAYDGTAND